MCLSVVKNMSWRTSFPAFCRANTMDDKETMLERIGRQLSEIEILLSMYPKKGEIELEDQSLISTWRNCVDQSDICFDLAKAMRFVLKLETFEVDFYVPLNYPLEHPNILVRTAGINKNSHGRMMAELKKFMVDLSEDISMVSIIGWLQENIDSFRNSNDTKTSKEKYVAKKEDFTRLWIHSHHIYSSKKRKTIGQQASRLNLNGICVPGKPGIIIVEGNKSCVDEFWTVIHSMQWQKISVKAREDACADEIDSFMRFDTFQECLFSNKQSCHSDLGDFYKYLEQKGFANMFCLLFGIDGKHT